MNKFFTQTKKSSECAARVGILHTAHGDVETPIFMPVGTQATVKSLDSADIEALNAQIILANTYHLHLRPNEDLLDTAGGLHKFMHWDKPTLTDSGGFQVFSLGAGKKQNNNLSISQSSNLPTGDKRSEEQKIGRLEHTPKVKIDEEGVDFTSHIDGSTHRFTPESAIQIQHKIGADIIMAFDECTPDKADLKYATDAMGRTHRWAKRCIEEHGKDKQHHGYPQYLFGIIQGGVHRELREESARVISSMPFDGIALGGESIGYNMPITADTLDWVVPIIESDRPRYTMGVGFSPRDLFTVVEHGADMFDCVAPTRIARNGALYVRKEISPDMRINITNATFAKDFGPIDPKCKCPTCLNYSRAYIHHLFRTEELSSYRLATIHNLWFFLNLMREIREAIRADRFMELKNEWV